jgi:plastocyanin
MHTALQLAPVLAAEKSKVPFYVAGGVLVLWALTLSMVIGMREPKFPDNLRGQRAVSAVTIALVAATLATAVITSGGSAAPAAAKSAAPQSTVSSGGTPAPETTTAAPAAPASHLQIAADSAGLLRFDTTTLTAHAGTVTITMANAAPLGHNLTIAQGTTVLGATPTFTGGTRTLTLNLKPGRYVFYCSVPGHRQAGMEGTLTVQ